MQAGKCKFFGFIKASRTQSSSSPTKTESLNTKLEKNGVTKNFEMLKKWKKIIKLFATTVIVLIYATIGLFGNETLKKEERNKKLPAFIFESAGTTDKYSGTVKTIVAYSKEFKLRTHLEDRIECEAEYQSQDEEEEERPGWKYDKKLGIQIFSAYYDQRLEPYNYVRIVGMVPKNSSFYCQIWYTHNETTTFITQKALIDEIWSAEWKSKNQSCQDLNPGIISCLAPLQNGSEVAPSRVSFVDKFCSSSKTFVKIISPPSIMLKKKFVICVKPLTLTNFSKNNFLEWLKINQQLGADEIIIYTSNKTNLLVENYERTGFLIKKTFSVPPPKICPSRNFEESIWYKRKMEIIVYNDCFYSNLYHTKFLIPLDIDEIIVPKTGNNWFEAFRSYFLNGKLSEETKNLWPEDIENCASFSVRNAYFFPRYPKDAIIRSLMLPKRDQIVPRKLVKALLRKSFGETIFDRTIRSFRLSPKFDSVKSFVHVPKTLSVFNHYAFQVLGNATRQIIFPADVFQLNHYRNSCDPLLIDGCREFLSQAVFDDSLERFRNRTDP